MLSRFYVIVSYTLQYWWPDFPVLVYFKVCSKTHLASFIAGSCFVFAILAVCSVFWVLESLH